MIKILAQHDPTDVIGVGVLRDTADALWLDGRLELGLQSARDAQLRLKGGLIDGLSIGYSVADGGSYLKNGVRYLTDVDLWEVSLVTFPANEEARITQVKERGAAAAARRLLDDLRKFNQGQRALAAIRGLRRAIGGGR
jgi:HK97 family phage prohead protease